MFIVLYFSISLTGCLYYFLSRYFLNQADNQVQMERNLSTILVRSEANAYYIICICNTHLPLSTASTSLSTASSIIRGQMKNWAHLL